MSCDATVVYEDQIEMNDVISHSRCPTRPAEKLHKDDNSNLVLSVKDNIPLPGFATVTSHWAYPR